MAKQSMHRVYWSLVCTCAVEGYMMDMLDKGRWRWNCQAGGKNRGRPQRRFMAVFKEDIQRRMLGTEWGGGMKKSPCTAVISGRAGHKDPNHLLYQTTNMSISISAYGGQLAFNDSLKWPFVELHLFPCSLFLAHNTNNNQSKKEEFIKTNSSHTSTARSPARPPPLGNCCYTPIILNTENTWTWTPTVTTHTHTCSHSPSQTSIYEAARLPISSPAWANDFLWVL